MDFEQIIPERYRVNYDRLTGVWRILDTWNAQIKNISDLEFNIPDSHPAVKIISDLELNALVAHLDKIGWLDKILACKKLKRKPTKTTKANI